MVTCTYCGREMEQNNFCSSAHKMAFKRKQLPAGNKLLPSNKGTVSGLEKVVKKLKEVDNKFKVCTHGAMIGLCKYGCTK